MESTNSYGGKTTGARAPYEPPVWTQEMGTTMMIPPAPADARANADQAHGYRPAGMRWQDYCCAWFFRACGPASGPP